MIGTAWYFHPRNKYTVSAEILARSFILGYYITCSNSIIYIHTIEMSKTSWTYSINAYVYVYAPLSSGKLAETPLSVSQDLQQICTASA